MIVFAFDQALEALDRILQVTSLPGEPVNTSATWNGWDRKRSILRARATVELVLFGELVHAENGDDVLQRLVALQHLLHWRATS